MRVLAIDFTFIKTYINNSDSCRGESNRMKIHVIIYECNIYLNFWDF